MSFKIGQSTSSNKPPRIENGTYLARLVRIIDLGVQPQTDYQTGETKPSAHRAWIDFEFPTEMITVKGEEKPRWQGKEFTISYHEKSALTKLIKALDPTGKAKSLPELLAKPCMVTIGSTATGNPKITDVVAVPKGMPVPDLVNPSRSFEMDNPDMEVFEALPDFMKDKITSAENYGKTKLAKIQNTKVVKETAVTTDDEELPWNE